jgi:hypothetical protein
LGFAQNEYPYRWKDRRELANPMDRQGYGGIRNVGTTWIVLNKILIQSIDQKQKKN